MKIQDESLDLALRPNHIVMHFNWY